MSASLLEELRVFKRVAQKIRSTLVSGREEMVSPTVVSRSFIDSFEKMAPATSLVKRLVNSHVHVYTCISISGILPRNLNVLCRVSISDFSAVH